MTTQSIRQSAVLKGDWKLLRSYMSVTGGTFSYEYSTKLFNLKYDIGETKDLTAEKPDKVKELNGLIENWKKEMSKTAIPFNKLVSEKEKNK